MNKPILEAMGKWLTPELSQALEGGVIVEAKLNKAAAALYIKARFSAPLKEGIIAQTKAHLIERLNLSRVEIEFMVPKKEDEKSVLTENTQNPRVCLGKQICTPPMPISQLKKTGKRVVLCGEIFKLESRVTKKGKNKIISFNITDYTDSVPVRIFKTLKQCEKFEGFLKNGEWVILGGSYEFVEFLNQNVFVPEDITVVDRVAPPDTAPEKRVELHMHTNYSAMDGMTTATRLIERAALWGHKAVGITDHGVVQAFPEAASAGKKHGVKILYGCEGYYVDDRDFVDESGEKCKVDVKKARSNHIIIYARNKTG
ncbi:MAG: PHP domain-containing protein, partial [Oscillospiraceae bacterium]|nr:PHP domain-containing protein [Oscillospiraceae bacterium]